MPNAGWLSKLVGTVLLLVLGSAVGRLQEPQSTLRIAADSIDELRQWDPVINRLTNERTLQTRTLYDDSLIPGRRHEGLIQYYRGVPVYGGDVTRQTDRGATVSIFGTIYVGIDLDPSPGLTPADARRILATVSDAAIVGPDEPALVILPTMDGRYALAYRASTRNAVTYFLDAHDGRVLLEVSAIRYQSAVGQGRGARGDLKKMSTTSAGGMFRTQDRLRPAPILTLDTRGNAAALQRLVEGGRWMESDLAVDADNEWTQTAVVDAHAHMGWVYDYFFKNHRHQGIDSRNSPVVGVTVTRAHLPNNAFFILPPFGPDGGGGMFFGEGPTGGPIAALDVIAHEMMHGVTNSTIARRTGRGFGPGFFLELGPSSVVIGGETFPCPETTLAGDPFVCSDGRYVLVADHTGAIDEALSDVFGTAVEFAFHPSGSGPLRADYTIGEDLTDIGVFRSLQDPAALGIGAAAGVRFPDHVGRRLTFALVLSSQGVATLRTPTLAFAGDTPIVIPDHDDGGVHWNSTILSHVFYLAVEGGQNRSSGRTVRGVGTANRGQIEQVFFRATRDLLPSVVSFGVIGPILRQAALDVHGPTSAATTAINEALAAVGL